MNSAILNIAGLESPKKYNKTDNVKAAITKFESENKKTITLTVNRMLTGTTVAQWDTMIYLKDTASPQEYDQAIFRLQSQYIKKYEDEDGNVIKYNMKPQTLLVDFSPNRMFYMQEQKAQFYNANTNSRGNNELQTRIAEELSISPIIVVNSGKITQITPTDLMAQVSNYSSNKSVVDEAIDIPVDLGLLSNELILNTINSQSEINSKDGFKVKAAEGEGDDIDTPGTGADANKSSSTQQSNGAAKEQPEDDIAKLKKKFATYYSRILFFAFLSKDEIRSLSDIVNAIEGGDENFRVANNLGLDKDILRCFGTMNSFILSALDYKIGHLNMLSRDTTLEPMERVKNAMRKFGRISESEITTPNNIAADMVDLLPEGDIDSQSMILDIASKQGEFALALYNKFGDTVKDNIYSIPTSTVAYEFTRKVYETLGMPVDNIFSDFTSYDIIKDTNAEIIERLKDMKFNAVLGNPPYQLTTEGTSDSPVYHLFMDAAFNLSPKVTLITPGRFIFNAGKTPKAWNEKVLNDKHFKVVFYKAKSTEIFDNVSIKGGVAVTFRDSEQDFGKIGTYTTFEELNSILKKVSDSCDFSPLSNIIYPQNKFNLSALYADYPDYKNIIGSEGREKRLTTSIFEQLDVLTKEKCNDDMYKIMGLVNNVREERYISFKYIESHKNILKYKVVVPKSNGSGAIGEVLSTPMIGEPMIGFTQSFIGIGAFESYLESQAAFKYIKTKFARTMLGILKVTQDNSKEVWKLVPLQDFTENSDIDWSKSVEEIDQQLYKKYNLSDSEIAFIESTIKPM